MEKASIANTKVGILAATHAGIPNPYAGITQIRFQGYALRPSGHPFGIFFI